VILVKKKSAATNVNDTAIKKGIGGVYNRMGLKGRPRNAILSKNSKNNLVIAEYPHGTADNQNNQKGV